MEWPHLPMAPDGEPSGSRMSAGSGDALPADVGAHLRIREDVAWAVRPVGPPGGAGSAKLQPWALSVAMTGLASAMGLGVAGAGVVPLVVAAAAFTGTAAAWVLGTRAQARRAWVVATADRVGVVRPGKAQWVERGQIKGVRVIDERPDGSGTLVVESSLAGTIAEYAPSGELRPANLVVGRVAQVRALAERIDLLSRDLR